MYSYLLLLHRRADTSLPSTLFGRLSASDRTSVAQTGWGPCEQTWNRRVMGNVEENLTISQRIYPFGQGFEP